MFIIVTYDVAEKALGLLHCMQTLFNGRAINGGVLR